MPLSSSGDERKTIRKDPFLTDTYKTSDGKVIRKDPFIKDQYNVYERGKATGTIREDPFIEDKWDLKEKE